MGDLMKKECLQERFDSARVHHILALWDRILLGLNRLLVETQRKVHWECEEVSIPFDKVENAKLVFLLSEGSHPTDGNDFLFLVINETVSLYNNFAEKLANFTTSNSDKTKMLHPRCIIRGYGGAAKVGAVMPLSKEDLTWVAECSWNSEIGTCEPDKLKKLLHDMINLHDRPLVISNPLDHLREKFCFRDDNVLAFGQAVANIVVPAEMDGNFFANYQDAQLVDEVHQLLNRLGIARGDGQMRRTLIDSFHCLDYDRIRAILEGSRSFLDQLLSYGSDPFQSVGSSLGELVYAIDDGEQMDPLQAIGFPKSEPQSFLVLSLDSRQFFELIQYTGYQLASEAYLFANLPLYMTDPLTVNLEKELSNALCGLRTFQKNAEVAVKQLDDFVRDVLSFYEIQIIEGAAKSNRSLRSFLLENNFCDASDPIFAALPSALTLRNYIALRQRLHQIKLSMLVCSTELDFAAKIDPNAKTMRGPCWLWEEKNVFGSTMDDTADEPSNRSSRDQWRLWFEKALPDAGFVPVDIDDAVATTNDINMESAAMVTTIKEADADSGGVAYKEVCLREDVGVDDAVAETGAARIIQRWWRRQLKLRLEVIDAMDIYNESDSEQCDSSMADVGGSHDELSSRTENRFGESCCRDMADTYPMTSSFIEVSYGTKDEEYRLRKWLDDNLLPQSMTEGLAVLGARSIEDVRMLVQELPEALSEFSLLDQMKVKKATTRYRSS
jgi:hypothetical protein